MASRTTKARYAKKVNCSNTARHYPNRFTKPKRQGLSFSNKPYIQGLRSPNVQKHVDDSRYAGASVIRTANNFAPLADLRWKQRTKSKVSILAKLENHMAHNPGNSNPLYEEMQGRNSSLGIHTDGTHNSSDPYGKTRLCPYVTLESLNHQFKVFRMTKYAHLYPWYALSPPLVSDRGPMISPCSDSFPISEIPLVTSPKPYIPPYQRFEKRAVRSTVKSKVNSKDKADPVDNDSSI